MTTANFAAQPTEMEELNDTFARQVNEILEEADQPELAPTPEVKQWAYGVPFAGVRYYGFTDAESR